jgi:indole-3-glycerol phosphate synthase
MSVTTILGEILAHTRQDVAERKRVRSLDQVLRSAPTPFARRSLSAALGRPDRLNVIAEFKRRSPSRGVIREGLAPAAVARSYEANGAAALSVLTEDAHFGGSLEDLAAARGACRIPVLRKDFVVDAYQVGEAWVAGADAVLLIVAALSDADLVRLLAACREHGLEALVEAHDRSELERALLAGAQLVGVNCRDLRTMQVDTGVALALADAIPESVIAVAESGIRSGDDLRRLHEAGYDAFLVGERLMTAEDPGAALRTLLAVAAV